jgi:hypothetical protein
LISAVLGALGPKTTIYIGTSHHRLNGSYLKINNWDIESVKEGDRPLPMLPLTNNYRNMETIDAWARYHEAVVDFGCDVENDP